MRAARAEAEVEAARICAEVAVRTDAEVADLERALELEIASADAAAERHHAAAVARVVGWVTRPEP